MDSRFTGRWVEVRREALTEFSPAAAGLSLRGLGWSKKGDKR
jgi:hypothetical protein